MSQRYSCHGLPEDRHWYVALMLFGGTVYKRGLFAVARATTGHWFEEASDLALGLTHFRPGPRTDIRIGTRVDKQGSLENKVSSVQDLLK